MEAKFTTNKQQGRSSRTSPSTRRLGTVQRFRRCGFGVAIAIVVSGIALLRMTESALLIIRMRYSSCLVGAMGAKNEFFLAGFLLAFAVIGYRFAHTSNYGVRTARCVCLVSAVTWLLLSCCVLL